MAAWVGPAITAVGGVISSLFGGKKKTENRVNYQQMVADAEAAGFNPLTVLRNGGSAGYMQTAHPGLSSGEVIGQALGNVGNFLADFDPYADDKRELASRLAEAQIANLNASTATMFPPAPGKPGSFNVPSWGAANVEQRPSGKAGQLSASGKGDRLWLGPAPEAGDRTVTNPWSDGIVNPDVLDAEAFENRYGDSEAGSTGVLWRNMSADMLLNLQRWWNSPDPFGKVEKIKNPTERQKSWWPTISIPPSRNANRHGW